jgi:hypothetical protein
LALFFTSGVAIDFLIEEAPSSSELAPLNLTEKLVPKPESIFKGDMAKDDVILNPREMFPPPSSLLAVRLREEDGGGDEKLAFVENLTDIILINKVEHE